jgi:hypothetical protein
MLLIPALLLCLQARAEAQDAPEGSPPKQSAPARQKSIRNAPKKAAPATGENSASQPEPKRAAVEPPPPAAKPDKNNPPKALTKVSDFEGCWTSEPGFKLFWTGDAYYYYYCFDKSGRARSYAARLNRSGQAASECRFGSTVRQDAKGFVLTEDAVVNCPGWADPGVYDCKLRSPGLVNCDLRMAGRKTTISLRFQGESVPPRRR